MRDDGSPGKAGMRVEARIFLVIGSFVVLAGVVYGVASGEHAGTTMLLLSAAMALWVGLYLSAQARRREPAAVGGAAADQPPEADHYLPEASIWPFGLGAGAVLLLAGLALGAWATLPGLALAVACTFGYARQSRRRD